MCHHRTHGGISLCIQVGCLYMLTRLIYNVSQVFLPLYVNKTLKLATIHIALVPLTVFLSGFITTTFTKPLSQRIGRKFTYLIGKLIKVGTLPRVIGLSLSSFWSSFASCSSSLCIFYLCIPLSLVCKCLRCHFDFSLVCVVTLMFTLAYRHIEFSQNPVS